MTDIGFVGAAPAVVAITSLLSGRLIGVVEVFAARDGVAEVAFTVDAAWRRRGIGSALLEALRAGPPLHAA